MIAVKLRKKIGIAAGVCLLLLAAAVLAPASWALDTWGGDAASTFESGSGTEIDPYIIRTGAQLAYLGEYVTAGWDTTGIYFRINDDIDLNGSVHLWTPIGYYQSWSNDRRFRGHFNGNGHVISNMRVSQTGNRAGLFGDIDETALVENIALANADVRGEDYVGALVGYNNGGEISNCVAIGQVAGNGRVGGLVGYNDNGIISNSMSSCAVTGNDYIGGLVGYCYSDNVSNSISNGSVTGSRRVGGLIGQNQWSSGILS